MCRVTVPNFVTEIQKYGERPRYLVEVPCMRKLMLILIVHLAIIEAFLILFGYINMLAGFMILIGFLMSYEPGNPKKYIAFVLSIRSTFTVEVDDNDNITVKF
ncbi:MAG: hypothetical protein MHPSP_001132 [Paramarteilia canceri]